MKLNSLLAATALMLGTGASWAATSVISNLPLPADTGASDLSLLIFPSSADTTAPTAVAISLGGGFTLSNIRITVLDTATAPSTLLDHTLSAGNAYYFQVQGSLFADVAVQPATPVPEPGTYALMLSGLALVALKLRSRLR